MNVASAKLLVHHAQALRVPVTEVRLVLTPSTSTKNAEASEEKRDDKGYTAYHNYQHAGPGVCLSIDNILN
jgi:hypothetical protein